MSLEQRMQVSMATLRAATARHFQTDGISGDTYHHKYLLLPIKGRVSWEQKHATSMNRTQSKLHVLTLLASKTHRPCKTLYGTPQSMAALKCSLPANGSNQTFSKLHLTTEKWQLIISLWLTIIQYGYHNSFASEALLPDWKNVNVHSNRTSCLTLIELNGS